MQWGFSLRDFQLYLVQSGAVGRFGKKEIVDAAADALQGIKLWGELR